MSDPEPGTGPLVSAPLTFGYYRVLAYDALRDELDLLPDRDPADKADGNGAIGSFHRSGKTGVLRLTSDYHVGHNIYHGRFFRKPRSTPSLRLLNSGALAQTIIRRAPNTDLVIAGLRLLLQGVAELFDKPLLCGQSLLVLADWLHDIDAVWHAERLLEMTDGVSLSDLLQVGRNRQDAIAARKHVAKALETVEKQAGVHNP